MYVWIIVVIIILLILALVAWVNVKTNENKYQKRKWVVLTFYVDDIHELIAFEATKRLIESDNYSKRCKIDNHITLVRVSGNNYHFNGKVLTFENPTSYYNHMYSLGYTIFGGYTSTATIQVIRDWIEDKEDVKVISLGSATNQLDKNSQFYRLYPPYSQSRIWAPLLQLESLTILFESSEIINQLMGYIPHFKSIDVSNMTPEEAAQQVQPGSNVLLLTSREKLAAEYPEANYYALDFFNWLPLDFNQQIRALQARIVGNQVFFSEYQINYVNQVHPLVAIASLLSKCVSDKEIQSLFSLDCFNDRLALETEEQVYLPKIGWFPSYLVNDEPLVEFIQNLDINIRQATITYIQFLRAIHNSPCEYTLFWNSKLLEEIEELIIPEELLVSPPTEKCFWNR